MWWARSYLVQRLLGKDYGVALRRGNRPMDRRRAGSYRRGPATSREPYRLLEPIDTIDIFEPRVLRLPTKELHDRIGTYDRFDVWEDGHYRTHLKLNLLDESGSDLLGRILEYLKSCMDTE
jgi:hypothetical protein